MWDTWLLSIKKINNCQWYEGLYGHAALEYPICEQEAEGEWHLRPSDTQSRSPAVLVCLGKSVMRDAPLCWVSSIWPALGTLNKSGGALGTFPLTTANISARCSHVWGECQHWASLPLYQAHALSLITWTMLKASLQFDRSALSWMKTKGKGGGFPPVLKMCVSAWERHYKEKGRKLCFKIFPKLFFLGNIA